MKRSSAMETLIKKGYLGFQARGAGNETQWTKRFYVLYKHSEKNQARIDWYSTEEEYVKEVMMRKTLYLENVKNVTPDKSIATWFHINMKNPEIPSIVLEAENPESRLAWVSKIQETAKKAKSPSFKAKTPILRSEEEIYEAPHAASKFSVHIIETDASRRCKLHNKYDLVVSAHHVTLQDKKTGSSLYTWPYTLVRRYGKSTKQFNIEAGRKCDSGAGLFSFGCEDSGLIFHRVQEMTSAMKHKSDPVTPTTPNIPDRNFSDLKTAPKPPLTAKPSLPKAENKTSTTPNYTNVSSKPEYAAYDQSPADYDTIESASQALESQYAEVGAAQSKTAASYPNTFEAYAEPEEQVTKMSDIAASISSGADMTQDEEMEYDHINLQKTSKKRNKTVVPAGGDNMYGSLSPGEDNPGLYAEVGRH